MNVRAADKYNSRRLRGELAHSDLMDALSIEVRVHASRGVADRHGAGALRIDAIAHAGKGEELRRAEVAAIEDECRRTDGEAIQIKSTRNGRRDGHGVHTRGSTAQNNAVSVALRAVFMHAGFEARIADDDAVVVIGDVVHHGLEAERGGSGVVRRVASGIRGRGDVDRVRDVNLMITFHCRVLSGKNGDNLRHVPVGGIEGEALGTCCGVIKGCARAWSCRDDDIAIRRIVQHDAVGVRGSGFDGAGDATRLGDGHSRTFVVQNVHGVSWIDAQVGWITKAAELNVLSLIVGGVPSCGEDDIVEGVINSTDHHGLRHVPVAAVKVEGALIEAHLNIRIECDRDRESWRAGQIDVHTIRLTPAFGDPGVAIGGLGFIAADGAAACHDDQVFIPAMVIRDVVDDRVIHCLETIIGPACESGIGGV